MRMMRVVSKPSDRLRPGREDAHVAGSIPAGPCDVVPDLRRCTMQTQPLHEMSQRRLNIELVAAAKRLEMHRQDGNRPWCVRRCEESWPCAQHGADKAWFDRVAEELKARASACEDARKVWQR